jgi:flagellar protein FlgJ
MQVTGIMNTQLSASAGKSQLKTVCQQFEAILWQQVLRAMKETVPSSGLLDEGSDQGIYQDMLFDQYAQALAKQDNHNGVAEILYRQLIGQQN